MGGRAGEKEREIMFRAIDTKGNLEITRGDSGKLTLFPFIDETCTTKYVLEPGEYVMLSIRPYSGAEAAISKKLDEANEDGDFEFIFSAEETAKLKSITYIYDVALHNADGTEKFTFLGGEKEKTTFAVV